ncbi:hypothetical protein QOZ80_2BG0175960 [Eleusine coracana subsp. coracana]|nr:hypothetical protein QOZ80_2BG0175960 [Eleusine coracana subsp. coracana]
MGRSRKDALAADGSGDPAPADLEEEDEDDGEKEQSQEEQEEDGGGEEDGDEEAEEQETGKEASGETAEQGNAEGWRPKLAEGFFEVEDIRRRRRRRGQLQYLVKWRWWPETANTWEPVENLKDCCDIIDAFEKRSQSPRSSRKRKRKTVTTTTTDPNPSRGKRGRPPRSETRSLPRPPTVPKILPCRKSSRRASNNSSKTPLGSLEEHVNGLGQRALEEGSSGVVSTGFPSQGPPLSVSLTHQQDEHHPLNSLPKVGNSVQAPPSQGGQVTGAKKRKSGCVRRFKLDEATQEQGDHRGPTSEKPGNEYVDSTEGEIVDKNKGDEFGNHIHVTKIIKPVRYFASIMDGVQQVSITFRALKSDGAEVLVSDKQLKAKNPLVLIDYYEQHLRYNPTS